MLVERHEGKDYWGQEEGECKGERFKREKRINGGEGEGKRTMCERRSVCIHLQTLAFRHILDRQCRTEC